MKLTAHIENFLHYCAEQKTLSEKTIRAYSTDLNQYSVFSEDEYTREKLIDYIAHMHSRYKAKTAKRKIATLKAFTHYLMVQDIIDRSPFDKMDTSFREPQTLPKTIPVNIIRRLLESTNKEINSAKTDYAKKCAIRNAAIFEILFATGARVSEICQLTPQTVDLENHTVMIFGKGSKERIIQIENEDVLNTLNLYYRTFYKEISESGYFFVNRLSRRLTEQSVRGIINRQVSAIGYDKHITPHMFRHSFATMLLEEDVDIRYIQKILGHSSITTTQIYTHVAMAKQKEILSVKHPRNKIHF